MTAEHPETPQQVQPQPDSPAVSDSLHAKQQALDLLSTVVDNTEDAIYAQDEKGRYSLFNRAACHFMGKTAAQVLGKDDHALFPAAQAEMLAMINHRIMATGIPETHEGLFDTVAGQRYFVVAKRPLLDRQDRIIGTFGIARDITEQRQAEQVRAESELRYRTLTANILGAVYRRAVTPPWRVMLMSAGVKTITGYPAADFLRGEAPLEWANLIDDTDYPLVKRSVEQSIEQRRPFRITYQIRHADGIERWVHEQGRAIYDATGQPLYLDGVIIDTTEHKLTEEELRQHNAELERFNRATIGRELDMIALKREINELCRELGRRPPYDIDFATADTSVIDLGQTK